MLLDSLNQDFRDLLVAFCRREVEFMVVGAYALARHGHPRGTGDFDVFVRPSPENADRIVRALLEFGAPLAIHGVTQADFGRPNMVYQIGNPPRRIDILTSISGVTFDEAWPSRVSTPLGEHTVHFLGRDMLIQNKRAAGRPKDLADVAVLEQTKAPEPPA